MLGSDTAAIPFDPAVQFEEHRSTVRAAYTEALDGMLDEVVGQFLLPDQQALILTDAAQFTVFTAVAKIVAAQGGAATDRALMQRTYVRLMKAMDAELPLMLNLLVDAARAGEGA